MPSPMYAKLLLGLSKHEKTFLSFKARPLGNYTLRQLSLAAAYTMFCHGEIESYLELWATRLIDLAEQRWNAGTASRPLVHMCTFHEGRGTVNAVPSKNIWTEVITKALMKHKSVVNSNNGIKEPNVCALLSPLGFDTRLIDPILLADLNAFGVLRGQHAHNAYTHHIGTAFDPFDRRTKVAGLRALLLGLDAQLEAFEATA